MNCWQGLEDIPIEFEPSVVTIGNFDGVHAGHQQILQSVADQGQRYGLNTVALTFDPHPLQIVAPEKVPETLTSIEQRVELIGQHGVDNVVILPFTRQLANLSPEQFSEQVLAGRLNAHLVIVGSNFRFGYNHAGDVEQLVAVGSQLGFEVEVARTVFIKGKAISSTWVRSLVRQGQMREARYLLGREFSLRGTIVKGEGIGSRLTVPTLNLVPQSQVLPGDGVYITLMTEPGSSFCRESITNVGFRPTFNGQHRTVETFLLGELGEKNPGSIELKFLHRIRSEKKFQSAQLLKEQIQKDVQVAKRYFTRLHAVSRTSAFIP